MSILSDISYSSSLTGIFFVLVFTINESYLISPAFVRTDYKKPCPILHYEICLYIHTTGFLFFGDLSFGQIRQSSYLGIKIRLLIQKWTWSSLFNMMKDLLCGDVFFQRLWEFSWDTWHLQKLLLLIRNWDVVGSSISICMLHIHQKLSSDPKIHPHWHINVLDNKISVLQLQFMTIDLIPVETHLMHSS